MCTSVSVYVCLFQMDLMPFVNKAGCECLNESDDCGFDNCLIKDTSYLESDCDEQVSVVSPLPVLKNTQHRLFLLYSMFFGFWRGRLESNR